MNWYFDKNYLFFYKYKYGAQRVSKLIFKKRFYATFVIMLQIKFLRRKIKNILSYTFQVFYIFTVIALPVYTQLRFTLTQNNVRKETAVVR